METICPKCLEVCTILLDLADGDTCTCMNCDEEYTVADVRGLVAAWGPLLKWIDAHPARAAADAPTPA